MAKKTLYHAELCKMGDVQVLVDSDPIESTYKRGTKFVALKINGEDRSYTPALLACADAFRGYKGQTVTVRASGSDYEGATDAQIQIFGAQQRQSAPPQQQQRPANNQQAQQPAANNTRLPIHGQTVGMAVKMAGESLMAQGVELSFEKIWPIASMIVRTCRYMEAGNLAPKNGQAQRPPAQPAAPPPPQPTPPPPPQSDIPPGGTDDDLPF